MSIKKKIKKTIAIMMIDFKSLIQMNNERDP